MKPSRTSRFQILVGALVLSLGLQFPVSMGMANEPREPERVERDRDGYERARDLAIENAYGVAAEFFATFLQTGDFQHAAKRVYYVSNRRNEIVLTLVALALITQLNMSISRTMPPTPTPDNDLHDAYETSKWAQETAPGAPPAAPNLAAPVGTSSGPSSGL